MFPLGYLVSRQKWLRPGYVAVLVVLLGLLTRVWHLDYDQGMGSHPDERSNGYYASDIVWPNQFEGTFTSPQSSLNPFWNNQDQVRKGFTYGHFPLYTGVVFTSISSKIKPLAAALGLPNEWLDFLATNRSDSRRGLLAARLAITLLDTLTVGLVYLTAKSIYGWRTGLLAAFLYAVAMQPVKDSHYFTFDPASTTFVALALYGSLQLIRPKRDWRTLVLTGIGIGLAVASKFSSLPIAALPLAAFYFHFRRNHALSHTFSLWRAGWSMVGQLSVIYAIAFVAFALSSPFALLDFQWYWDTTVVAQGNMVRGVYDWVFTRQYRRTWPYIYFIRQQLQWGLWYPLGLTVVIGTIWTIFRLPLQLKTGRRGPWPQVLPGEMLLLIWIFLYFGITGAFLAKFNRYMLPVLPMLNILGAAWIGWVCDWWGRAHNSFQPQRFRALEDRIRKALGPTLLIGVVGGSCFWLSSYINGIWARDHTWLTASYWIYEQVPDGSSILWEAWDDSLPVSPGRMPSGHFPGQTKSFERTQWAPFDEDTRAKLEDLKGKLVEADYVIYSSNRVYDAVVRLPERYPMTIAYYAAMFDGSLGFEVAYESASQQELLGFRFDETGADESWSLYDHPPVIVMQKTRNITVQEIEELLAPRLDEAVIGYITPGSFLNPVIDGTRNIASHVRDWLRGHFNDEDPARLGVTPPHIRIARISLYPLISVALPLLDNFRFNDLASGIPFLAAFTWWAALFLLGLAAWPLCFSLFSELPDKGYALARLMGWLAIAVPLWWLGHAGIPAFTVIGVRLTASLFVVTGAILAIKQWSKIKTFTQERLALLISWELGLGLTYAAFVLLRLANPDLWQPWFGGEKFMEMAIWNGILRSPMFPPIDPHFSGETLNYYYFGHYLLAVLTKLTGIWPEVGFNLAIPSLFGLSFLLSWASAFYFHARPRGTFVEGRSVNCGVQRPWAKDLRNSLWAPFLLLVIGNPQSGLQVVESLVSHLGDGNANNHPTGQLFRALGQVPDLIRTSFVDSVIRYDWWQPSRVIPHTINEFPVWSFAFGDLHAHLLAMPLTLLLFCFTILAALFLKSRLQGLYLLILTGMVCGLLPITNIWELPIALFLTAIAILVGSRRLFPDRLLFVPIGLVALALSIGVAALVSFPFWRNFNLEAGGGLGWVSQGDDPWVWLTVWALFYSVVVCWLLLVMNRWSHSIPNSHSRPLSNTLILILVGGPFLGLAAAFQHVTFGLVVIPLALACIGFLRNWRHDSERAVMLWCILLLGIWAGSQVIFIRDFMSEGDHYRMNTVFKFFFQGWILAGMTCGILIPNIWRELRASCSKTTRQVGAIFFVLLLGLSLGFPLVGIPARLGERFPGPRPQWGTLNGLDFMNNGSYVSVSGETIVLSYDREAIDWLNMHVFAPVTILESAQLDYYRAGGTRIASLTGLPGLMGMHQREQRPEDVIAARWEILQRLWNTFAPNELLHELEENSIGLIYLGQLEQIEHSESVRLYREMAAAGQFEVVFENARVMILALPGTSQKFLEMPGQGT